LELLELEKVATTLQKQNDAVAAREKTLESQVSKMNNKLVKFYG
jgi:hypothetical protein